MPLTDKDLMDELGRLHLQVLALAAENRDLRAEIEKLKPAQDNGNGKSE